MSLSSTSSSRFSHIGIGYSTAATRRPNRLGRNREVSGYRTAAGALGPVSLGFLLIIIVGILALLYLTQITKTTVYGYRVSQLSDERQNLAQRNQELQIQAARLQAIARIESSPVVGSLQTESQPTFVSTPASSTTKRAD